MILPAQTIRRTPRLVVPFVKRTAHNGMTYGLSGAGYDVRIRETRWMWPFRFTRASTIEHLKLPLDLIGHVADKSTWARRGIAVQNTIIEAGWYGYLTLEITNHSWRPVLIRAGDPIAQIVFHRLEEPTEQPYEGRYQGQPARPVGALKEPIDA